MTPMLSSLAKLDGEMEMSFRLVLLPWIHLVRMYLIQFAEDKKSMNTSVMMEPIAETSPRLKAKGEVSLNWYWETRLCIRNRVDSRVGNPSLTRLWKACPSC
jgi:hypothetical protein